MGLRTGYRPMPPTRKQFKQHSPDSGGKFDREIALPDVAVPPVTEGLGPIHTAIIGVTESAPTAPPAPMGQIRFTPKQPTFVPIKMRDEEYADLNAAARKLMEYLPEEDLSAMIEECAGNIDAPVWQVILGYVLRAREDGAIFAPVILPDWQVMVNPKGAKACGTCGERMLSKNWVDGYCCNECSQGLQIHGEACMLVAV